ncbi:MAG: class IV adenylate cyclase, partial [Burkholderiales bacterium]|nr:class IV adenylate cyclase [Anaerolineae bacterium]
KLYVSDLQAVAQRLEAAGAELTAPRIYERNVRYDDGMGRFSRAGSVLRLRQDTRVRLTYKADKTEVQEGVTSRSELEVEVSDFDTMEAILNRLGFYSYMIYEKYRTTYTLDGAEIVLDEMPYGNFVEIEGNMDAIRRLLPRLELDGAPRYTDSYTRLFDYVCRNLNLNIKDLTFANFESVDVPESALQTPSA